MTLIRALVVTRWGQCPVSSAGELPHAKSFVFLFEIVWLDSASLLYLPPVIHGLIEKFFCNLTYGPKTKTEVQTTFHIIKNMTLSTKLNRTLQRR